MENKLKEAAENYGWRIKTNTFSDPVKANELAESAKQDFIEGAKWQQERMYSEEDMRKCWNAAYIDALAIDEETYKPLFFEDFIEQFKKK